MRKEWERRSGDGRMFAGILVTAIGVIFLLNNLGIIEARNIMRVWFFPMILIVVGVGQLLRRRLNQ